MDRFDAMATLVAAVDCGSLSAASRALGVPLATVSRKVSELEGHLRTQLLIRTSRKLVLTEAGLAYVAASRRILDRSRTPSALLPVNIARRAAISPSPLRWCLAGCMSSQSCSTFSGLS